MYLKLISAGLFLLIFAGIVRPSGSLPLTVTFPAHSDTFNTDLIRIAGYADPQAYVTVNRKQVHVFPHGAFVTRVKLEPLMNKILVRAANGNQVTEDILFVFRPAPEKEIPAVPTVILPTSIQPRKKIWLMSGDYVNVRFRGSPDGHAYFSIDKIEKNIPMVELDPSETDGLTGVYHGIYKIGRGPTNRPLGISINLRGKNGKRIRETTPGKLYIIPDEVPVVGMTLEPTVMYGSEKSVGIIGSLDDSVRVHIIGKFHERLKIRLGDHQAAYIDTAMVRLLPPGTPLPSTDIFAPTFDTFKDWDVLSLGVDVRVPFTCDYDPNLSSLEVVLYGAHQQSHWITFPNQDTKIDRIFMKQSSPDQFNLNIDLKESHHWGHQVRYEGKDIKVFLRRDPVIASAGSPVFGLRFAIDAGHGGDVEGATSPTGMLEKDINLTWAKKLRTLLVNAGARVVLTRENDSTMDLQQRVDIARKANSLIFISLHNNSTVPSGNPLTARGTGAYFTAFQSRDLASEVYFQLVKLGLEPYGRVYNSYYVTNVEDMLSILVEGVFMSNPEEEMLLMDDNFIDRLARAVFRGVEEFLNKQR
ncbi:N-acetylmuramoyl-L-alanine amidase [candidate division KSB1 bacterium]|nr:N-acetylmuramoyl-L-alanine amidase [candidate division KSB1 bacterium]